MIRGQEEGPAAPTRSVLSLLALLDTTYTKVQTLTQTGLVMGSRRLLFKLDDSCLLRSLLALLLSLLALRLNLLAYDSRQLCTSQ